MEIRILLTTSGGGNAINVIRSLRHGDSNLYIVGVNIDKYELAKSNADVNYLVPRFTDPEYFKAIEKIIEKEKIDFMIPNHEFEIEALLTNGNRKILEKCFLPDISTVKLCNDKFILNWYLHTNGFEQNVPRSQILTDFKDITTRSESSDYPVWVRLTKGAGSRGATLVHDHEEFFWWVKYWMNHYGVDIKDFMISDYLPGEDHHYFSLWRNGEMLIGKAIKRLKYCCSKYTLTGTSSSPSLCVLVADSELDDLSEAIIKQIDSKANGLFGIDYKQDKLGNHCLTEINVGRFPRINYIFNLADGPNIAKYYLFCGLGIGPEQKPVKTLQEGNKWYLFRDFDHGVSLKHVDDIENFEKI